MLRLLSDANCIALLFCNRFFLCYLDDFSVDIIFVYDDCVITYLRITGHAFTILTVCMCAQISPVRPIKVEDNAY